MCLRKPAYHGKPSQIPLEVTDLSLGLNHVLVFLFGLENTDLIEVPRFNPKVLKILGDEVKLLNIFYNETDSKNHGQDLSLAL